MKKLFVVGCPRSGTTWTVMLLARHPQVVGCMQVGIIHALEEFRRWWAIGEKKDELRYINSIVLFPASSGGALAGTQGKPSFAGLFDEEGFYDYCRSAADDLYHRVLAHKPGATLVADKTPENIRYARLLGRVYPDASFLHVIRDPRSVVSSLRHGAEDFGGKWPRNALDAANYWRDDLLRGRAAAKTSGHYREVRYEVMLQNGPAELQGLLEWLGLEADPAWCAAAVAASSIKEMKTVAGTPKNFFRKGSATAWRQELTDTEIRTIEYEVGDLMTELGYDLAFPRGRMPLRLAVEKARRRGIRALRKVTTRLTGGAPSGRR